MHDAVLRFELRNVLEERAHPIEIRNTATQYSKRLRPGHWYEFELAAIGEDKNGHCVLAKARTRSFKASWSYE